MERMQGKVKWFSDEKGYGFITRDDGQGDVFCHYKAIADVPGKGRKSLVEAEQVEFSTEQTDKGLRAVDVVRV